MPFLFGKIYPEVQLAGMATTSYRLLVIYQSTDKSAADFLVKLQTLNEYLGDLKDKIIKLVIHTATDSIWPLLETFGVKNLSYDESEDSIEGLVRICNEYDIDLVVTENEGLRSQIAKKGLHSEGYEKALSNVEIFVRGHEIPWSFSDPVWYMPWSSFYVENDSMSRKVFQDYSNSFRKMGLENEALDIVRTLLLRLSNICYTRDKLLFYVIQKRASKRHGLKRQDFTFEASYYLCHYYVLLWGGVDQLARILNLALGINEKKFIEIGLGKDKFVAKIAEKDAEIGKIFEEEDFKKWLQQLGRNRHYVAHEGSVTLSPLVEEPKEKISEEELEQQVQDSEDYQNIVRYMPPEIAEWSRNFMKETLRLSRFTVLAEDVMSLKDKDKQVVFKPLQNIERDFNSFELMILKTFDRLKSFLERIRSEKQQPQVDS